MIIRQKVFPIRIAITLVLVSVILGFVLDNGKP